MNGRARNRGFSPRLYYAYNAGERAPFVILVDGVGGDKAQWDSKGGKRLI